MQCMACGWWLEAARIPSSSGHDLPRCLQCLGRRRKLRPDHQPAQHPAARPTKWAEYLRLLAALHSCWGDPALQEQKLEEVEALLRQADFSVQEHEHCAQAAHVAKSRAFAGPMADSWELLGDEPEILDTLGYSIAESPCEFAVSRLQLPFLQLLLRMGQEPNFVRFPRDEDPGVQPTVPLSLVLFQMSDCMLSDEDCALLAEIATLLLQYGADPSPALALASRRYGPYDCSMGNRFDAYQVVNTAGLLLQEQCSTLEHLRLQLLLPPGSRGARALVCTGTAPRISTAVAVALLADWRQQSLEELRQMGFDEQQVTQWARFVSWLDAAPIESLYARLTALINMPGLAAMVANGFLQMPFHELGLSLTQKYFLQQLA